MIKKLSDYVLPVGACLGFCALALLPGRAWADEEIPFDTAIRPLIQKYCVECHDAELSKGDLNLDRFTTRDQAIDSMALWQRAGTRIEKKEMPPRKHEIQPTDDERALLTKWIGTLQIDEADCNMLANEESVAWYSGDVMSRRLNRMEYEYTLRDLLGVELSVAHLFPADGAGGEGFDNDGAALFLSAIQMEKYLAGADLALETALPEHGEEAGDRKAKLIPVLPSETVNPRDAARQVLEAFAYRAWRKPPPPESLEGLLTMFDRGQARGDSYEKSIKLAMKAALVSPHFMFLAEPHPPEKGNYALGGYELASRLSYFLWSSMPDDTLLASAASGALEDPNEIQVQVKRMLQDPKADGLGRQFGGQWLGISQLGETVRPDEHRFPEYTPALQAAMRAEAFTYFNTIIREDRSLLEFIQSDYAFVNKDLAAIYGIPGVEGEALQRVQLADASRGGVLGMGAVLMQTSHALRTSPVLRGKWVMETILGAHVPPPPPNVPSLPADDRNTAGLTFRQQLEVHRENAECAGCHSKMDPLGFGLENYDPIGRWRATQADQPIDASGVLPTGETFNGPGELKAILMNQKEAFANNFARKMLGYALGRGLNRFDNCVIDESMKALRENEFRPSVLITQIVLSFPFRHRYSSGTS